MSRKSGRVFPPLFFPLNTPPSYLFLISRSSTLISEWLAHQDFSSFKDMKIHKCFHPGELYPFRDRQQDCSVVVLEMLQDPIFFREEVGRVKIYFMDFHIIRTGE